jgi:hypothetical protein
MFVSRCSIFIGYLFCSLKLNLTKYYFIIKSVTDLKNVKHVMATLLSDLYFANNYLCSRSKIRK